MKKTKKEIKKLVIDNFDKLKDAEVEKMVNMFYDLQGFYIEVLERQQLKQGRTVYGGWPYSLTVNVYDIKSNKWSNRGSGRVTGDYASHNGIECAALDCISKAYNIDDNIYLCNYNLLKSLNITLRVQEMRFIGKLESDPFKWYTY